MRFSGRPPVSEDAVETANRREAPPLVRSVRTPDRVLRERRAAERDEVGAAAAAPVDAIPSWLKPFASGPNARFTRTPDSILRGRHRLAEIPESAQPMEPEAAAEAMSHMSFAGEPRPVGETPATLRRIAAAIRVGEPARPPRVVTQDNAPEPGESRGGQERDTVASPITGSLGQPFASFAPVTYRTSFGWAEPAAPKAPSPKVARPAPLIAKRIVEHPERVEAPAAPAPEPQPARHEPPAVAARSAPVAPAPRPAPRLFSDVYELPPLELLTLPQGSEPSADLSEEALEKNSVKLQQTLQDFGVRGEIIDANPGPVVTLYELEPAPGVKSSRVIALASDIARSMSAKSARVAVVEGRNVIGIELPNRTRETVFLRELLESPAFTETQHKLPVCLGKTIGGEPVIADLAKMPHLLVAGTTGSGKSVAINTMILSLLYMHPPEKVRLIMVDPKMLELSVYEGIPHLLTPVVTDPKKAVIALKWAVREMEDRYRKMSKLGVRNIDGFNARAGEAMARGETVTRQVQAGFDRETGQPTYEDEVMDLTALPYIVVIVDEMADLMMVAGKDIEGAIQRLAQMARAAGIHIIMATQRPSVDVITGTIKANFPTRISFQVTSKIDSRTILGEMGAEQLLGQGDMLHMQGGGRIARVHGPFCSDAEVEKVVDHLKLQGRPEYLDAVTADDDEMVVEESEGGDDRAVFDAGDFGEESGDAYDQAVAVVLRDRKASTSYIQRRLQIGYNRAASIMERMEQDGIVGQPNHAGKREIYRDR
jgi:S-DNA-T family DNA segregation ATPase FtsK/SpoIIIE